MESPEEIRKSLLAARSEIHRYYDLSNLPLTYFISKIMDPRFKLKYFLNSRNFIADEVRNGSSGKESSSLTHKRMDELDIDLWEYIVSYYLENVFDWGKVVFL